MGAFTGELDRINIDDYIPTEPSTPVPLPHILSRGAISPFHAPELDLETTHASRSNSTFKVRRPAPRASSPPVPIIAPPEFVDIPRAPLSREDAAEARLKVMLEKENRERVEDGLASRFPYSPGRPEKVGDVITVSGLIGGRVGSSAAECKCEECVDSEELSEDEDEDDEDEEYSDEDMDDAEVNRGSTDGYQFDLEMNACIRKILKAEDAHVSGLEDEFRREVIAWFLDVNSSHICTQVTELIYFE